MNTVDYTLTFNFCRELKKLSEESLTRQPEEVFDILCKLGEGSYGSVFKALHKESRQILAIKQVITRPSKYDLTENTSRNEIEYILVFRYKKYINIDVDGVK